MNKDQWTVIGLIALLTGLEIARSKTVRSFFVNNWKNFNAALGSLSPGNTGSTNPSQFTKVQSPTPQGKCPNGWTKFFDQFGIAKCGQ